MKRKLTVITFLIVALAFAASDPGYHLLKTIPLTGDGGQDYLAIDQSARRLYVTHGTQVEVIDLNSEQPVGKIEGMNGTHGVAIASKHGRGFITSGITKTVKMFDLKTLQSLADIPVSAEGPDGLAYEPGAGCTGKIRYNAIDFARGCLRPDCRDRSIHALLRAPVQIYMRTFARKRLGNRESNPCRRSSDEHNLVRKFQVHSILQKKAIPLLIQQPSKTTRTVYAQTQLSEDSFRSCQPWKVAPER